jgi:hypothetical protein
MDGRPPKKALSSYLIFVREKRSAIFKENPTTPFREMMGVIANRYREMSSQDREVFDQMAEKDRIRNEKEKGIWVDYLKHNP